MKIELHNFGPIKFFEFDLEKDLTVVYGENNIGKSYAISAVYLILKNLIEFEDYLEDVLYGKLIEDKTDEIIDDLFDRFENVNELTVSDIGERISKEYIAEFLVALQRSLENSFPSLDRLDSLFTHKNFEIVIGTHLLKFVIILEDDRLKVQEFYFHTPFILKKIKTNSSVHLNNPEKNIFYCNENQSLDEQKKSFLAKFRICFQVCLFDDSFDEIKNIYFIPDSRSGLSEGLNNLSKIFAQLSQQRNFLTQKTIELPSFTEPVSDYLMLLSNIPESNLSKKFNDIVSEIEKNILKGEVVVDSTNKKLKFFSQELNKVFELSFTSSMVSELAPIVAYFKFILNNPYVKGYKKNTRKNGTINLLFIEEPEAHLHPKVQVALMEIFVRLSQMGVKIVMTSHSDYMFSKLSNLVLGEKIAPEKVASILLRSTPEGSVADDSMKAEPDGMHDENFVSVTEELYNERIELFNKLHHE